MLKTPQDQDWKATGLRNFSPKTARCLTINIRFGYQKVYDKYLQLLSLAAAKTRKISFGQAADTVFELWLICLQAPSYSNATRET